MLAEVDSAGRVTPFPGTTFLHINGALMTAPGTFTIGHLHLHPLFPFNFFSEMQSLIMNDYFFEICFSSESLGLVNSWFLFQALPPLKQSLYCVIFLLLISVNGRKQIIIN